MAMGKTILELQGMMMLKIRPKEEEKWHAGCRHMPVTQNQRMTLINKIIPMTSSIP